MGVTAPKADAPVAAPWLREVRTIANDLRVLQSSVSRTSALVHCADARRIDEIVSPQSVDAVITSPPYPNEKDYTCTMRLESVLLNFVTSKEQPRRLKRSLVRSNTRGVYKGDDDDKWVSEHPEVHRISKAIEARRLELGKTSGFERQYGRVTRLYFGGMARHLANLRNALRPGPFLPTSSEIRRLISVL